MRFSVAFRTSSWRSCFNEVCVFVGADSRLLLSIQNGFDGDIVSGDESDQDGLEESPVKKKPPVQQGNQVQSHLCNMSCLGTLM